MAKWDSVSDLNREDIIDSRDMEEAITELEELEQETKDAEENGDNPNPLDEDQVELLKALREVREACSSEWKYGVTYIRDSYFKDYAQDLADDLGMLDKNSSWPDTCIDWDDAARELQMDYSSIDIGGIDYWYRD